MASTQKSYYLKGQDEDFGDYLYRVKDLSLQCFYGYIFTQNDSSHRFKEVLKPQLYGLEAVLPLGSEFMIDLEAGESHIVVLRRTKPKVVLNLQYQSMPKEASDDELKALARGASKTNYFGQSDVIWRVYNSLSACSFYFENQSEE